MRLGSTDWAEADGRDYGIPDLPDDFIVVHREWTWVGICQQVHPEWFIQCWPDNLELLYTHLDIYRTAKIYYTLNGFAEMPVHEFITRSQISPILPDPS